MARALQLLSVYLVVAFAVAGCSSAPADTDGAVTAVEPAAPSSSTSQAPKTPPPANFTIDAPELMPGNGWIWHVRINYTEDAGSGPEPGTFALWNGFRVLSTAYTMSSKPVVLASAISSFGSPASFDGEPSRRGVVIDPETLAQGNLWDFADLHECQAEPSTCPTTIDPVEMDEQFLSATLKFPLTPGKTWSSPAPGSDLVGTSTSRVVGEIPVDMAGTSGTAIHIVTYGNFTFREDGESGKLSFRAETYYSPSHKAVVREAATLIGDIVGDGTETHIEESIERDLVEMSLDTAPEPDAVELYDLLGLYGRRVYVSLDPAGQGKYDVDLYAYDVPLDNLRTVLLDGNRKVVDTYEGKSFEMKVEAGSYILRAEAWHNGRLLASSERPLSVTLREEGYVTCDVPTANPGVAGPVGACEDFAFKVQPGGLFLLVWVVVNDPLFIGVSGDLELLDANGTVVEAQRINGGDQMLLSPDDDAARGTWKLRFSPDNGLQTTVDYDITGYYDYPDVEDSTP